MICLRHQIGCFPPKRPVFLHACATCFELQKIIRVMVLILDGTTEIGAHKTGNLCHMICLRHLIRWRVVTNRIFCSDFFLHTCATCSELSSNISTMVRVQFFYCLTVSDICCMLIGIIFGVHPFFSTEAFSIIRCVRPSQFKKML